MESPQTNEEECRSPQSRAVLVAVSVVSHYYEVVLAEHVVMLSSGVMTRKREIVDLTVAADSTDYSCLMTKKVAFLSL